MRYVVVYYTKAGYVSAWSEHVLMITAMARARERVAKTGRPHWVARVEHKYEARVEHYGSRMVLTPSGTFIADALAERRSGLL